MLGDSEFEDFHPYVDFASKNDEAPPELADAIRHLSQTLDTDQRAIFDAVMRQIHAGDQFFHVVTAGAGAGKSRLLAAITAAAHANGINVAGLSFMRKSVSVARSRAMMALATLQETGLETHPLPNFCNTIHALALRANREAGRPAEIVDTACVSEFLSKEIVAAAAAAQRRTGPSAPPSRLVVDGSCESDEESDDDGDGDDDEVSKKSSSVSDEELKKIAEERTWQSLFDSFGLDLSEAKSLQAKFEKAVAQIIDMRGQLLRRSDFSLPTAAHDVISRTRKKMEARGLVDQDASIMIFANADEYTLPDGTVLLVDEAQDLNEKQIQIIIQAFRRGTSVVIVGDQAQGVMGFAGAASAPMDVIVNMAKQHIGSVQKSKLLTNYRSTKAIIKVAESVLSKPHGATSTKEGEPVTVTVFTGERRTGARDTEEWLAAREIVKMIQQRATPANQIAIIRYKNFNYADPIAKCLSELSIPYHVVGKGSAASPLTKLCAVVRVCLGRAGGASPLDTIATACRAVVGSCFGAELGTFAKSKLTASGSLAQAVETFMSSEFLSEFAVYLKSKEVDMAKRAEAPGAKKQKTGKAKTKASGPVQTTLNFSASTSQSTSEELSKVSQRAFKSFEKTQQALLLGKDVVREALYDTQVRPGRLLELGRKLLRSSPRLPELFDALTEKMQDTNDAPVPLDDMLEDLEAKADENAEQGVLLTTIHKLKGGERSSVYVTGMGSFFFHTRLSKTQEAMLLAIEDEKAREDLRCALCRDASSERTHVAFVGLSRALDHLHLQLFEEESEGGGIADPWLVSTLRDAGAVVTQVRL